MAFIRTVRTGSGATAVQLVEKRRGRRWILEHLGSAHTEAELAVLMDAAERRLEAMAPALDLGVEVPVRSARLVPDPQGQPEASRDPCRIVSGQEGCRDA